MSQVNTPSYQQFSGKLDKFVGFLKEHGAEVLVPTNEWEALRFDSALGVGIVYFNKRREIRFTGQAKSAWTAYRNAQQWNQEARTKRKPMTPKQRALLERDGDSCFLCRLPMGDDLTVEHLVAVVNGGPHHISNLFLAHFACNTILGHLSAVEKIRMRENYVAPCACHADEAYERIAG